jgi:uncharacterized SAM-binding protein YcdF (DUF218 family)
LFLFAKIAEYLLDPWALLSLAVMVGAVLLFTRRWRAGRILVAVGLVGQVMVENLPLGPAAHLLEDRFPPPAVMPERVDGIIVLGGAIDPVLSAARGRTAVTAAADRVIALLDLVHRYPGARAVYSGGSGRPFAPEAREAPWMRELLVDMGSNPEAVAYEDRSRNTRENALFSREMMQPQPGETWLLVTSALHMPRAVGAFRGIGWPVVAYPVDYQTAPGQSVSGGRWLHAVMHEALGLAWYRLQGWSPELLPAPEP